MPVFNIYLRSFIQNLKLGLAGFNGVLGSVSFTFSDLYFLWFHSSAPFQLLKDICLGILIFLTIVMLARPYCGTL